MQARAAAEVKEQAAREAEALRRQQEAEAARLAKLKEAEDKKRAAEEAKRAQVWGAGHSLCDLRHLGWHCACVRPAPGYARHPGWCTPPAHTSGVSACPPCPAPLAPPLSAD